MEMDPDSEELIGRLLAADDPYFFEEADGACVDDAEDSDYVETPARKKPRGAKARVKGQKARRGEAGRRARKDTGQLRGRGRFWTEQEEKLFEEALNMYGRSWSLCAGHVGTRDSRSVASHAQKHFIKLCLQGKPLPEKVAESGVGYTLSGKPLDPVSPSARAYGFKKEIIRGLDEEKLEIVRKGILMENLDKEVESKEQRNTTEQQSLSEVDKMDTESEQARNSAEASHPIMEQATSLESVPAPTSEQDKSVKTEFRRKKRAAKDDSSEYMHKYRTDYALNRPQRAAARNRRVQIASTSESIQLVECEEFMNSKEGNGVTQPFTIDIAAEALLLMDFHAHLSEFEIIGLLAGTWDAERRHLTICEALPCQRAEGTGAKTAVELDPASEVHARAKMVEKGLVGTGWYHSHPVFSATPSMKDIENQRNYQTLFRHEESKVEPFIGLIISPYDTDLPTPKSNMTGFFVLERHQGIKPFRLKWNVVDRLESYTQEIVAKCEAVLHMLKADICRMNLKSVWRKWTFLKDGKKTGDALTKIAKLKLSLLPYFAEDCVVQAKALGEALVTKIEHVWEVSFQKQK